jgi:protease-4
MQTSTRNPLTWVLALSAAFFVLFVAISGGIYLMTNSGGSSTKTRPGFLGGDGVVGIVELTGVIMDSKRVLAKLDKFEEDDQVKAVVLRLNSPGGAVAPSQEIYEAVKAYKKPLVVSMASVAASGAFYIACGAKKVYANPGTLTGSIGVIMEFMNLSKLYEWAKVQRYSIKTGKFKDAGADYREMQPEERALMQTMVNDVLAQFKRAVGEGRKLKPDQVDAVADGRILSGAQAKADHLVDELGTLQDAINEAGRLGKIKKKPKVVYSEKPRTHGLLDLMLDDGPPRDESRAPLGTGSDLVTRIARAFLSGGESEAQGESAVSLLSPGVYWLWKGAH